MRCMPNGNFDTIQCVTRQVTVVTLFNLNLDESSILVNGDSAWSKKIGASACTTTSTSQAAWPSSPQPLTSPATTKMFTTHPTSGNFMTSCWNLQKSNHVWCALNLRPCEAEHSEMRRMAAGYEADDGRYFYSGSKGPTCSVDGWYDKVQQSRENATQLYWDG